MKRGLEFPILGEGVEEVHIVHEASLYEILKEQDPKLTHQWGAFYKYMNENCPICWFLIKPKEVYEKGSSSNKWTLVKRKNDSKSFEISMMWKGR